MRLYEAGCVMVVLWYHMVHKLHRGVGSVGPWLLGLPEHSPQERLVVVNEGVDGGARVDGASRAAAQLVEAEDTGQTSQEVPASIVYVHALTEAGQKQQGKHQ